jgi:hypothetical protein
MPPPLDVTAPVTARLVPVAAPRTGVVSVGEVDRTMFTDPVTPDVETPPMVGVVSAGLVIVCTPVNEFAASVLAMVAEEPGNVIFVPSVPARVKLLLTLRTFPLAGFGL